MPSRVFAVARELTQGLGLFGDRFNNRRTKGNAWGLIETKDWRLFLQLVPWIASLLA